jgi:hypothetical protein
MRYGGTEVRNVVTLTPSAASGEGAETQKICHTDRLSRTLPPSAPSGLSALRVTTFSYRPSAPYRWPMTLSSSRLALSSASFCLGSK